MQMIPLKNVTGPFLRSWFTTLCDEESGCGSAWYATSEDGETRFCVVMGVLPGSRDPSSGFNRGLDMAWMIGIQSVNNAMQSDMLVDFDQPRNRESGEVEDTFEKLSVADFNAGDQIHAPLNYASWDCFAEHVRAEARRVYRLWK